MKGKEEEGEEAVMMVDGERGVGLGANIGGDAQTFGRPPKLSLVSDQSGPDGSTLMNHLIVSKLLRSAHS